MRAIIIFLGIMLLLPLVNADIGPAPEGPDITIKFEKNNQTYYGVQSIVYHCNGSTNPSTGAVEVGTVNMSCMQGVCKNDFWYYKFNPCFFSSGYFSYEYGGKTMKTGWMNFTTANAYEETIDVETGKSVSSISVPKEMYELCCAPSFILPVFLGLAILMGRRDG